MHYFQDGRIGDHVIRGPHILGHECSGVVVEAGRDVKRLKPGQRVAVEPGVPCFSCSACLAGRYNLCDSVHFIGAPPYHGAFREYLAHDARFAFPLPESVSFTQGAMVEPLAVAWHTLRMVGVSPGQTVLVVGAGPIGFSCLEMALLAGAARVIVSEPQAHRREMAESLGAGATVDPSRDRLEEVVRELTGGRLCDCVLEASGSATGIAGAIQAVRRGGSVAFVGMGRPTAELPHAQILKKEVRIQGIYRYANAYPPVLALLAAGRLDASAWISHRLPLDRIQEAMEMSADDKVEKLKMIITNSGELAG